MKREFFLSEMQMFTWTLYKIQLINTNLPLQLLSWPPSAAEVRSFSFSALGPARWTWFLPIPAKCRLIIIVLPAASEGWGKVIFSVWLSVHTRGGGGGGVPQSQVLSQVSGPRSFPGGYPCPGQGVPPVLSGVHPPARTEVSPPPPPARTEVTRSRDRLRCGRCASCGFPQGDFLVLFVFNSYLASTVKLQIKRNCKKTSLTGILNRVAE